eukprot:s1099_g19.t2
MVHAEMVDILVCDLRRDCMSMLGEEDLELLVLLRWFRDDGHVELREAELGQLGGLLQPALCIGHEKPRRMASGDGWTPHTCPDGLWFYHKSGWWFWQRAWDTYPDCLQYGQYGIIGEASEGDCHLKERRPLAANGLKGFAGISFAVAG